MKMITRLTLILITVLHFTCKKYLDQVPDKSLAIPTTLKEFRGLLDNDNLILYNVSLGDYGSDDYYLTFTDWQAKGVLARNCYIWAPDIYEGDNTITKDWNLPYQMIYIANVVLEGLKKIQITNLGDQVEHNNIKAQALFYRASMFYNLQETYGNPYKPLTADTDLGIPLRLSSKINEKYTRASVQATYDQIINDLIEAKDLVTDPIPTVNKNRPCKASVYAMLSKIYLSMQQYPEAAKYADSCITSYGTLLDYNTISLTSTTPFDRVTNPEIMFFTIGLYSQVSTTNLVDTTLYQSYNSNDLRKSIFFQLNSNKASFNKRGYSGASQSFYGIATDEIYLIRAECYARAGNTSTAMTLLNSLLLKRWKTGTFTSLTAATPDEAIRKILEERRKELVFRGIRWADLRRLNQDPRFAIQLKRVLNGQTFILPPNDNKYTMPIPEDEINLSGIPQNPR